MADSCPTTAAGFKHFSELAGIPQKFTNGSNGVFTPFGFPRPEGTLSKVG